MSASILLRDCRNDRRWQENCRRSLLETFIQDSRPHY
jgi:hypothetical protein